MAAAGFPPEDEQAQSAKEHPPCGRFGNGDGGDDLAVAQNASGVTARFRRAIDGRILEGDIEQLRGCKTGGRSEYDLVGSAAGRVSAPVLQRKRSVPSQGAAVAEGQDTAGVAQAVFRVMVSLPLEALTVYPLDVAVEKFNSPMLTGALILTVVFSPVVALSVATSLVPVAPG